jgi:hypothetical protein
MSKTYDYSRAEIFGHKLGKMVKYVLGKMVKYIWPFCPSHCGDINENFVVRGGLPGWTKIMKILDYRHCLSLMVNVNNLENFLLIDDVETHLCYSTLLHFMIWPRFCDDLLLLS